MTESSLREDGDLFDSHLAVKRGFGGAQGVAAAGEWNFEIWNKRFVNICGCNQLPAQNRSGENELMAYVIAEPCIGTKDTACVDACPVDCIHPKKDEPAFATSEMLYIDPVECIDCGACVPVCPVSAIFALDDLPEKWKQFTEKNAAYYGRSA